MLVLTRKLQQEIVIGDNVKITVLKVKGNTVRLGIEAPRSVRVVRGELEPTQEEQVQVTVVFDENSIVHEATNVRDVVPFRNPKTFGNESHPRMEVEPQDNSSSISFNGRLPESLQHHRLKQIVQKITNNKKD